MLFGKLHRSKLLFYLNAIVANDSVLFSSSNFMSTKIKYLTGIQITVKAHEEVGGFN